MSVRRKRLYLILVLNILLLHTSAQEFDFAFHVQPTPPSNQSLLGSSLTSDNGALFLFFSGESDSKIVGETFQQDVDSRMGMLVKVESSGDVGFRRQIELKEPDSIYPYAHTLAVDKSDNIYLMASIYNTTALYLDGVQVTQFTPQSNLEYQKSIIIIKLNPNGQYLASWQIDLENPLFGLRFLKVAGQNLYVFYSTESSSYRRDGNGPTVWNLDYRLMKFDLNGQLKNQITFTGLYSSQTNNEEDRFRILNIGINDAQEVYLTGNLTDMATTTLTDEIPLNTSSPARRSGSIVIKLDRNLEYEWKRTFTGGAFTVMGEPSISPDGGMVTYFSIQDDASRGNPKIRVHELGIEVTVKERLGESIRSSFNSVVKLSSAGELEWTTVFNNGSISEVFHSLDGEVYFLNQILSTGSGLVGFDSKGNPFQTGRDGQTFDEFDNYIIKLSEQGEFLNTVLFEREESNNLQYISTSNATILPLNTACDEFYFAAMFKGKFDFDPTEEGEHFIESYDDSDIAFVKFNNSAPRVIYNDGDGQTCSFSQLSKEFTVLDENITSLNFQATTSDNQVLPPEAVSFERDGQQVKLFINTMEASGLVTINVEVTDDCGLRDSFSFVLNIEDNYDRPLINDGTLTYTLCAGQTLDLSTGDTDNVWSDGSRGDILTVSSEGEYWVKRISPTGCESENSDTVRAFFEPQPLQPIVSASGPLEFCEGDQVTLTSDISENILWSTGETTQSITVSESGVYTVWQQSDICGDGTASEEIEVIVYPIPEQPLISVSGDTQFCEGGSITLSTVANGNISWSNGLTGNSIEVTETGEYTMFVERNGCVSQVSDPINIIVDKDFQFNIVSDTTVCEGVERLALSPEVSGGPVDYLWSDGSNSSTLVIDQAGQYWLEVSNGTCEKPRVYIEVSEACYPKVYIPNVFSPNGDGVNDTFQITGIRVVKFDLSIFNNWGNQVFHSSSIENSWDGRYKGNMLSPGRYPYRLVFGGELNGQPIQFSKNGIVSLIN